MKLALFVSALASASAFAPAKTVSSSSALSESKADLEALAGKLNPQLKYYDPLVSNKLNEMLCCPVLCCGRIELIN